MRRARYALLPLLLLALAGALGAGALLLGGGDPVPAARPPGAEGGKPIAVPGRAGAEGPRAPGEEGAGRVEGGGGRTATAEGTRGGTADEGTRGSPRWALWRLLDASTGKGIPWDGTGSIRMKVDAKGMDLRFPVPARATDDGRVEVFPPSRGAVVEGGGVAAEDSGAATFEIRVRGYRARTGLPPEGLEGERDVALDPAEPSVRGVLVLGPGVKAGRILADLNTAEGHPLAPYLARDGRPPDLPDAPGPFVLYDLPDGRWRLDAWSVEGGVMAARGSVAFEKRGGPVDVGEVRLLAPVRVLARVVARDGTPVLDRDLSIRSPGGEIGSGEALADGWVEFRGLEPDGEYVVASSLAGLERAVRAPATPDREVRVELRWEGQGVRCRLRFTVEGQDPVAWGDLFEGPALEEGAWRKDGFLEHDMAAGEYLLGIWARPVGKGGFARCFVRFTVPDRAAWDATLDLREGRPE